MSWEVDVRVIPRSSQEKIEKEDDSTLKIWVRASPTDGQANDAVCALIAKALHIPRTGVSVIRGQTSRRKRILVNGLEPSDVQKRLFF